MVVLYWVKVAKSNQNKIQQLSLKLLNKGNLMYQGSIKELHQQLVNKERSAVEIAQATLKQIETVEPKVKAFLTVTADQALATAKEVDAKIAAGEEIGILAGVPMGIKDNMCTKGIKTTCASQILANFVPPYESTVTQKLKDAGAVFVGKTNLDEFAMGGGLQKILVFK